MATTSFSKLLSQNPFLSLLQNARTASQIFQIHAQLICRALMSDSFVASRLLFAACELSNPSSIHLTAAYAELIFSQVHHPNTFFWNTIIRFHSQTSNPLRALLFFSQMRKSGIFTDNYTYPFVLKACASMPGRREGVVVHGEVVKRGFDEDLFVRNGLISMYCRSGDVELGMMLFDGFRSRDLVSWNSMIAGYSMCGKMGEAQKLFDAMPERDAFSWAILIDGYGKKIGDVRRARELFDAMPDRDLVCWNSMIDGYSGLGMMGPARELFEAMPERNVISWSILIDGYIRHGDSKEALNIFQQMLRHGMKPDKISAVGVISACAQLGALDQGRWVHFYLKKNRILFDVVVQTALIDMYMKCGSLDLARRLFDNMRERSIVTWNVMIVGLGANGYEAEAVELFDQMEKEGTLMDDLTFLAVLTACTHAGLVAKGWEIFDRMRSDFGITPKAEHYGCIVDLLGRAGRLHEARNVIETMPMKPTLTLWGSLLAACRTHRCVDLAEVSVEQLKNLGADDSGVYVLLSNIYAEEGMWDDVWRIRKLMCARGMKKEVGRSVVEVNGRVHEFVNGDVSYLEIFSVLWSLSNNIALT
ncbi:pentatricopeptide repeat-containing protein At3g29230-like [Phoenix dactylifera]|uniref:Pentatricopeptide repeat-containing protein At3g29230-like n=1 Tax=Phoenix dactylifera TaxID=42345 RepID=A0A8B9ARM3_PHODC|nr:pentatricopeptide repeat-containing protein At3g29230-like [Phoenix dactylifera]